MTGNDIIKLYMNATSSKRVNIIKHYTDFMGVVDGYINGLFYRIESEKESYKRQSMGELGIRVQNSGTHSDPMAKRVNDALELKNTIIRCDFSGGIMEGVEEADKYMRSAKLLKDMRRDYEHFQNQLCCLGKDKEIFEKYLCRQKTLTDIKDLIGEATEYDKKQQLEVKKPKSRCKSVSAFANTLGGSLIFGISDSVEALGLDNAEGDAERISETIKSRMDPAPEFKLQFHNEKGKMLIVLDVFNGSIISLIENGENFIKRNAKMMWRKTANSREEMPEYVERSYHEALVNGLGHRDYLIYGSEVHIDIYDDRMEIYSPGGMPDGSIIQERDPLTVPSTRRNPVLADVLNRLGYMACKGSGFGKIISGYEFQKNYTDNKKPTFRSDRYQFTVIMPNLNYVPQDVHQEKVF